MLGDDRAVLVHAQVGSGKTTVLVHRAAYLHAVRGVPLAELAILTFTVRAAAEVRARLDALLGRVTSPGEGWLIGTFHGVASALLRRTLPVERLGYTRGFAILDDDEAVALAVEVARRAKLRTGRRANLRARMTTDPALADLAAAAAAARRAADAMDFDELLEHATTLLGTGGPQPAHLLVDELQDCEPRELAFVRALAGPHTNSFGVGDPAQTIYGWRGSSPALFARAAAELGCRVRELPYSYRSSRTILEGARAALGDQPMALGALVPARASGAPIAVHRHHDPIAEAAYLAARLGELHARGIPWRDLAVLCRLRAQVEALAPALAARGIPCVHDLATTGAEVLAEPAPTEAVRVLTIHAAKGLEFAHVFVAGANAGVMPLVQPEREADHAEERRLFYVALTRARDGVEISYQRCPHLHQAFGVASPLIATLPAAVVAREDRATVEPPPEPAPPPPEPAASSSPSPSQEAAAQLPAGPAAWQVGQRVRHARYGTGTVTAVASDTIDCDFGKLGPRAFPRALCPLALA